MMEMNKMTRNEKKQRRIRQLKIRVISTLLILCLVIVAGGCTLIEKNKESKKVVRVNGGVVEKTVKILQLKQRKKPVKLKRKQQKIIKE